jgi:hypothetical protein
VGASAGAAKLVRRVRLAACPSCRRAGCSAPGVAAPRLCRRGWVGVAAARLQQRGVQLQEGEHDLVVDVRGQHLAGGVRDQPGHRLALHLRLEVVAAGREGGGGGGQQRAGIARYRLGGGAWRIGPAAAWLAPPGPDSAARRLTP